MMSLDPINLPRRIHHYISANFGDFILDNCHRIESAKYGVVYKTHLVKGRQELIKTFESNGNLINTQGGVLELNL